MASAGAQASHMEHVETQIPYVAPVASVSFGMYLLAGFWQNWLGCLGIGSLLLLLFLLFLSGRKSV